MSYVAQRKRVFLPTSFLRPAFYTRKGAYKVVTDLQVLKRPNFPTFSPIAV